MFQNWQVDFFRGVALDCWRQAISPEQTQRDVEFLETELCGKQPAQLLDVPCGNGRHSIELARRGHPVTGVDLSEEFIEEAQRTGGPLPATWIVSDMRRLPWREQFDGAFCFGNSFGYLDSQGALEFLTAVARALKPGSRFAIETGMAAESILPGLQNARWYKVGDIFMLSSNEYHPREGRLDIQYTFIRDGKVDTRPSSSYVLTVNEICRLHSQAGLQPVNLFSSVEREPYRIGSSRLILVSAKQ